MRVSRRRGPSYAMRLTLNSILSNRYFSPRLTFLAFITPSAPNVASLAAGAAIRYERAGRRRRRGHDFKVGERLHATATPIFDIDAFGDAVIDIAAAALMGTHDDTGAGFVIISFDI